MPLQSRTVPGYPYNLGLSQKTSKHSPFCAAVARGRMAEAGLQGQLGVEPGESLPYLTQCIEQRKIVAVYSRLVYMYIHIQVHVSIYSVPMEVCNVH